MTHKDKYRETQYFEKYIADQNQRIAKFKKVLAGCGESEREKICRYLASRLKDLISAQFSKNEEIDVIRSTVEEYADYLMTSGFSSYSEYIDFLSLLIIFGIHEELCIPVPSEYDDDLSRLLISFISDSEQPLLGKLCYPEYYGIFKDYCVGTIGYTELVSYIDEKWYSSSKEFYWFNSHLKDDDLYAGYWCYVGSAVIRIKNDLEKVSDSERYIV